MLSPQHMAPDGWPSKSLNTTPRCLTSIAWPRAATRAGRRMPKRGVTVNERRGASHCVRAGARSGGQVVCGRVVCGYPWIVARRPGEQRPHARQSRHRKSMTTPTMPSLIKKAHQMAGLVILCMPSFSACPALTAKVSPRSGSGKTMRKGDGCSAVGFSGCAWAKLQAWPLRSWCVAVRARGECPSPKGRASPGTQDVGPPLPWRASPPAECRRAPRKRAR